MMKKKSMKFFCVFLLCFAFSAFLSAEDSSEPSAVPQAAPEKDASVEENEEVDPVWEKTKEDARAVGGFFKRKAEKLDRKIQSNRKTACEGKWIFTNGEATTTILCNSDGTMNVRMDKGNDIKLWKGSFESTKKEISFHITYYSERINRKEKFDSLHQDEWKISYKVEDTEIMTLTSDDMEDLNGYKFVNPTVFSRVK